MNRLNKYCSNRLQFIFLYTTLIIIGRKIITGIYESVLIETFYKNYFYANRQVDWLPWVSTGWRLKTLAQLIQWHALQK
ncbi:hypothetical protein REG_1466 [Candidatus Regiella insecticola LSR1]|uniref:Uncharacterized protein n=1 Tax=Candidatus Regiella insecticola LSR1 TaxID=663321 RepID=E0WTU1_9ENTR|nr:hypothetical protein REG_1466 [Candidatus Regiella insecticola LSR1]